MGDESDAPAYLTAVGAALLLGSVWAFFVPFDGMDKPIAPLAALALATALFAVGAAVKAADRRHLSG